MNACLECLPCLGKNAVDVAQRSTDDPELRKKIVADAFHMLANSDYTQTPPYLARKIFDIALKYTGKANLYDSEKHRSNALARQLVEELPNIPEYDNSSFESRIRLAIAGNILDFGIYANIDISFAINEVKKALKKTMDVQAVKRLQEKMDSAKKILYILDNCGEAVFDSVFMEPYKDKITLAVRGKDVFNDVTAEDLPDCSLAGWKYIRNDNIGIPGVVLSECSKEFKQVFNESDLIIAKGQGNFETLNECNTPIAFLFLAKCPVVTRLVNAEVNSIQLRLFNF